MNLPMRITLVYSPRARDVHEEVLELADGCTVQQALLASALLCQQPDLVNNSPGFGVWGVKVCASHVLHGGDRVELYRPLQVDPKVARRARFEAQGARSAGLFARRRPDAKAGY